MEIEIRPYRQSDYEEICEWWRNHHECHPSDGMMVENGTFVLTFSGVLFVTLTAFYTQSKKVAFLEGFCAKPGIPDGLRHTLAEMLFEHCCDYLRNKGYTRVNILTSEGGLVKRYEELGMSLQVSGLHSLGKEI